MTLKPEWITGFTDGEGCFSICFHRSNSHTYKVGVKFKFSIALHKDDVAVLHAIKDYFGVGVVYDRKGSKAAVYQVAKLDDLLGVIIPHFDTYPLQSKKHSDYEKWRYAIKKTREGKVGCKMTIWELFELHAIKFQMNGGTKTTRKDMKWTELLLEGLLQSLKEGKKLSEISSTGSELTGTTPTLEIPPSELQKCISKSLADYIAGTQI